MMQKAEFDQVAHFLSQAERRRIRQQLRAAKREAKNSSYRPNGKREVARRLRQIERGSLQVSA